MQAAALDPKPVNRLAVRHPSEELSIGHRVSVSAAATDGTVSVTSTLQMSDDAVRDQFGNPDIRFDGNAGDMRCEKDVG